MFRFEPVTGLRKIAAFLRTALKCAKVPKVDDFSLDIL
jgi:hypothetical protein